MNVQTKLDTLIPNVLSSQIVVTEKERSKFDTHRKDEYKGRYVDNFTKDTHKRNLLDKYFGLVDPENKNHKIVYNTYLYRLFLRFFFLSISVFTL